MFLECVYLTIVKCVYLRAGMVRGTLKLIMNDKFDGPRWIKSLRPKDRAFLETNTDTLRLVALGEILRGNGKVSGGLVVRPISPPRLAFV